MVARSQLKNSWSTTWHMCWWHLKPSRHRSQFHTLASVDGQGSKSWAQQSSLLQAWPGVYKIGRWQVSIIYCYMCARDKKGVIFFNLSFKLELGIFNTCKISVQQKYENYTKSSVAVTSKIHFQIISTPTLLLYNLFMSHQFKKKSS